MNKVTLNLDQLTKLRAELAAVGNARVRVGILGNKADRFDKNWMKQKLNNPTLGLIHEFGSKGGPGHPAIPARSFIRMPLFTKLHEQIDKIGRAVWANLIIKNGLRVSLQQMGVIGENIIQRAFATGGFGQWKKLAKYTIRKKGSSAILIETAYMRKSITSAVVGGKTP